MRKLVQYYDEGWRYGYLVREGHKWARIERIIPLGVEPTARGVRAKYKTVPVEDVREVAQ